MIVRPVIKYNGAWFRNRRSFFKQWFRPNLRWTNLYCLPIRNSMTKAEKEMYDKIQRDKDKPDLEFAKHIIDLEVERDVKLKINYMKGMDLVHNEDVNGILYKYDLPIVNTPIQFRNQLMVIDEEKDAKTPLMHLCEKLEIDKDSSYEQYVIKVNQEFNNEIDMYGDISKAGSWNLKVLQFGVPIPHDHLENKLLMMDLRLNYTPNQDMPGSIENVHPNKFISNLRPVEEFRHTPIIPISEKELADYQKKRDAQNRKGYFVEIKKDTLYFYTIIAFVFITIGYVFYITNERQMNQSFEIEKLRVGKYGTSKTSHGVGVLEERKEYKLPTKLH